MINLSIIESNEPIKKLEKGTPSSAIAPGAIKAKPDKLELAGNGLSKTDNSVDTPEKTDVRQQIQDSMDAIMGQ